MPQAHTSNIARRLITVWQVKRAHGIFVFTLDVTIRLELSAYLYPIKK